MITIKRRPDDDFYVTGGELPPFKRATKKSIPVRIPIPVNVREMDEAFQVETLQGTMEGKPGDFLVTDARGEMYPCDRETFLELYDVV